MLWTTGTNQIITHTPTHIYYATDDNHDNVAQREKKPHIRIHTYIKHMFGACSQTLAMCARWQQKDVCWTSVVLNNDVLPSQTLASVNVLDTGETAMWGLLHSSSLGGNHSLTKLFITLPASTRSVVHLQKFTLAPDLKKK